MLLILILQEQLNRVTAVAFPRKVLRGFPLLRMGPARWARFQLLPRRSLSTS